MFVHQEAWPMAPVLFPINVQMGAGSVVLINEVTKRNLIL